MLSSHKKYAAFLKNKPTAIYLAKLSDYKKICFSPQL